MDYENKIAMLVSEIERLKAFIRKCHKEIDGWKQRYGQLEITIVDKSGIEYELTRLKEVISLKDREIEEWGKKYNEKMNLVLRWNN